MMLDDFLEKKERHQVAILKEALSQPQPLTRTDIRERLGISKLSVDSYLNDLANDLRPYKDNCVLIFEDDFVRLETTATFDLMQIYSHYVTASLKFQILDYALEHPQFTTLQIATQLMISESTLFRKTKEVNQLLKHYHVKIKNGNLQGPELQIRYLYFQLYWHIKPYSELQVMTDGNGQQKILRALEKTLNLTLTPFNRFRFSLWLTVSKKRLKVRDQDFKDSLEKMVPFLNDPLYLSMKQLALLFMSRYAIEMKEEESMLHFIFLISMSVLPEDSFVSYDLVRNRRSPITQADTWVRETMIYSYHPRKPSLALEKQMNYFISQINNRLYFFDGALLSPFSYQSEHQLLTNRRLSATQLAEDLLQQVLGIYQKPVVLEAPMNQLAIREFEQLLTLIDMKISHPIQLGVNLWLTDLQSEVVFLELAATFEQINGVVVSRYQPGQTYDVILSNIESSDYYLGQPTVFVATDWSLPYHLNKVKEHIQQLQFQA